MSFVSKTEFKYSIKTSIIDAITSNDDTILTELTDAAVTEMKGYLRGKYSADTFFSVTGDSRHKTLTMICRDITLYNLFSLHTLRKIPEIRITRYEAAKQWLTDVQQEKINPFLFSGSTGMTHYILAGSNDKRNNYQT
jgi:phage gp36-like protein